LVLGAAWAEPIAITLPFLMTALTKTSAEPLAFWPVVSVILAVLVVAPVLWPFLPTAARGRKWAAAAISFTAIALAAIVLVRPAYDAAHAQKALAFHVTAPARAFWMLAALDRLEGLPDARRGAGPEQADLFWLTPRWSRWVRESTVRTLAPEVRVRREGEETVIEVEPPPGTDFLSLVVEGARLRATEPPTQRLHGARVVLRQVVSGGRGAPFCLHGELPPGTRIRLQSATPGLPAPAPFPTSPARVAALRTLTVTNVPLP
ncbi:MAG: hypothetical protein ACRD2T_03570, partial [Thermoanaerobaculia bacterium]